MTTNRTRAYVVDWQNLTRWDLKSARAAAFRAAHPSFQPLGDFVEEATEIVHAAKEPDHEWPVYGVSNREGISLSHVQKGAAFNAPYKRIRADWFFHNPTRANVGSLGRVPNVPSDAITSPEYQVWKIKRGLLPDFLEILIRLPFFLDLIDCHRVGAVKERLFVENLFEIPIPVLNEQEQRAVVIHWRKAQREIAALGKRVEKIQAKVAGIVYEELGTPPPTAEASGKRCFAMWWRDFERWSVNYLSRASRGLLGFRVSKYPIQPLGLHLEETTNGYCIKPVPEPTAHKMLKLNALKPSGLDLTLSKFIKIPDRIATRFAVHKSDLFICRSVGSYEHVAKCALAKESATNVIFPDTMIRVRLKESLLPEYVGEVIQTPLGRSFFQSNARTAVGMWKIGADDIQSFPIPVPPLAVQRTIMERVSTARAEMDRERIASENLKTRIYTDIEALVLGTKTLNGK